MSNENEGKKYNKIKIKDNMNVSNEQTEDELPEKKELSKVVGKQPKKRKRNLFGRLFSAVLGPEGVSGIGQYVADEIIVPAVKNLVVDSVTSGINMVMYGENKPRTSSSSYSRSSGSYRPSTNYASRYSNTSKAPDKASDRVIPRAIGRYGVEEYIIEDRYDASHVLTTLTESADMYNTVSVADYYDLIGVPSAYTDNSYGWTMDSIVKATIIPIRGGYVIKFPPVEVV